MVRNDMFYIQYPYMPEAEQETNLLVSIQDFVMSNFISCCKIHIFLEVFLKKHILLCWYYLVSCLYVLNGW